MSTENAQDKGMSSAGLMAKAISDLELLHSTHSTDDCRFGRPYPDSDATVDRPKLARSAIEAIKIVLDRETEKKKEEQPPFDEETIQKLQEIRRANEAIRACAQILNEHGSNAGLPTRPGVFIRLEANQEMGLTFAIEACANKIAEEMNTYFEDLGVYWLDDICPEVTAQAQAADELQKGEITFDEFESRVNH